MRVLTPDGWSLAARHHEATGEPRGIALLLHAMMVDGRSMERPAGRGLAQFLAGEGWEVYVADFRGHGASGPVPPAGTWTYGDLVQFDVPTLLAAVREAHPGLPVVVVGQSLGAHVTAAAMGHRAEVDALVMLSGNFWLPRLEPSRRRRLLKGAIMGGFALAGRTVGHFPSRRLGYGPADEALPYVEDLYGCWRSDTWASRDGIDYLAGLGRIEAPVLAVVGKGDRWMCPIRGARAWTSRIRSATLWYVGAGDRGLDFDPGHMALATDPRSRPLWEHIATWMGGAV